ncbi:MAG: hypothetical protein S4CHLAM6_06300 [Chlamydiae bacterium]|nr:hypothetical protein [Chlamydiota bacterium]
MIKKIKFTVLFSLLILLSSCLYKMPGEDSYSLIPKTNNTHFIGEEQTATPNQATF